LEGLEELHLGRNKISDVSGLAGLSSLRVLGLASNRLTSFKGIETLCALRELYADHNGIERMAELASLSELHTLELSANRLRVVDCAGFSSLEELWLNANPIQDVDAIGELVALKKLKTLYLEGCPVSKLEAYRSIVLALVPGLQQLDADMVERLKTAVGIVTGTRHRDEGEPENPDPKRQART